jgi:transcriptional regulator with XRE-family HTH domain
MKLNKQMVGNIIQHHRNQKGLSQEVISGFAGIAMTHLTMIENGTLIEKVIPLSSLLFMIYTITQNITYMKHEKLRY